MPSQNKQPGGSAQVIARWPRDADAAAIACIILGVLKLEPHTADVAPLRDVLEDFIVREIAKREGRQ